MNSRVQLLLTFACLAMLLVVVACMRPGTDLTQSPATQTGSPTGAPGTTALPTLPIRTPQGGTPNPSIEIPPPIY